MQSSDWSGAEGSDRVRPSGELMLPHSQAPSRGAEADQRDPALRIGRRAWKECKHEDIFKLFPALAIRALESRGPEVSPALTHEERKKERLETSETPIPPTPTSTHPRTLAWASGQKFLLQSQVQTSCFYRTTGKGLRCGRSQRITGVWEST